MNNELFVKKMAHIAEMRNDVAKLLVENGLDFNQCIEVMKCRMTKDIEKNFIEEEKRLNLIKSLIALKFEEDKDVYWVDLEEKAPALVVKKTPSSEILFYKNGYAGQQIVFEEEQIVSLLMLPAYIDSVNNGDIKKADFINRAIIEYVKKKEDKKS